MARPPIGHAGDGTPGISTWASNLREIVTAIISLSIAATALWMLWDMYAAAAKLPFDEHIYERQKDILLLALSFFGTVTGYYLGRVPAERQADAARETARVSQRNEQQLRQQVRAGLTSIQRQNNAGLGGAADNAVNNAINDMLAEL